MKEFIRIGLDLGKSWFQVHGLVSEDGRAERRKLSRGAVIKYFAGIKPCTVALEACGSAHYWGRELVRLGHQVRLIPPAYVKPYVQRGKNDAADAAAICEAAARPGMRFVPIKSVEQQAMLVLLKTRELLVRQRSMSVNAMRGHLAEFGVVAAKGIEQVARLVAMAKAAELPEPVQTMIAILQRQIERLNGEIAQLEARLVAAHRADPVGRLLAEIPGIGPIIATTLVASIASPRQFRSGRDFAAWIGLVPRQHSTGGKARLGGISKQGNRRLRQLLVLGATSLIKQVPRRQGALRDWVADLLARKPKRVVTVALANKLARIVFAMLASGEGFRTERFERRNPA
jgi:transposase